MEATQHPSRTTAPVAVTMRAWVLTGPGEGGVAEVPVPAAAPGEVVVDVERVGLCGTDVEFFTGRDVLPADGSRPLSDAVGPRVVRHGRGGRAGRRPCVGRPAGHRRHDARRWNLPPLPARPSARLRAPAGGRHPRRPARCAGRAARRAGRLAAPAARSVDETAGALVEPGGNALRAMTAAPARPTDDRVLVARSWDDRSARGNVRARRRRRGAPARPARPPRSSSRGRSVSGTCWTERRSARPRRSTRSSTRRTRRSCRPARSSWSSRPGGSSTSASPAHPACSTPACSRSRTSPQSACCRRRRHSTRPSTRTRPGRSTRDRWSRPRSGSMPSDGCLPGAHVAGAGPKTHIDPKR